MGIKVIGTCINFISIYLIVIMWVEAAGGENAVYGYWAYKHGGTRKTVLGRNGESYHLGSSKKPIGALFNNLPFDYLLIL